MALSWSGRRQALYTSVGLIVVFIVLFVVYESFFTAPASCFNGKQDGDEIGVDCGGSCSLMCADTVHAPTVVWSRVFPTGGNYYTAAAEIQNNNVGAGAKQVKYTFQLFDANNLLVVERDGVVDLPPVQNIPIVEPNIYVQNRDVTHALFAFGSDQLSWNKVPANSVPLITTSQQNLSPDASKLTATLNNDTLLNAHNVTVTAVLYDVQGVARAASKSLIDIPQKSSVPVVFTWAGGVPNIVRAEITVLPSF